MSLLPIWLTYLTRLKVLAYNISSFPHGDLSHFLNNMSALLIFGVLLERRQGREEGAIQAALAYAAGQWDQQ